MRDEDDVQRMADKANDYANGKRLNAKGPEASHDFVEGVAAALDWVLDEGIEDDPLVQF